MADETETVGKRVVLETAAWLIASMLATSAALVVGLAVMGVYTVVQQAHHNKDIDRLDTRIDLECVKRVPHGK